MKCLSTLIVLLVLQLQVSAQPGFPPPSGVYCSCGPTTGSGSGSVDPAVAAKSFVKGILVRVAWDLLEPTDNTYNWALIDSQVSAANKYHKKIALGIGCGISIPQWVFSTGAQYLVSSIPYADTIALPWDNIFLGRWTEFISALGARYKNDTTIQLVYITNSTANGFEMQLPFTTSPTLSAAGYTDTKMIQSWETVIDAYNVAFPNHYLSNDFHPVNGSNVVGDTVYQYARTHIGARYGANAWWWTQKNTTVYPDQYTILQHSSANNAFTGVQFANNGTADSAKFGAGGMPVAMQLAVNNNVCYWEVWNQDILNPKFDSLLTHASCATSPGNVLKNERDNPFIKLFPNPARSSLHVEMPGKMNYVVRVINSLGMICSEQKLTGQTNIEINVADWPRGYYALLVISDSHFTKTSFLVE